MICPSYPLELTWACAPCLADNGVAKRLRITRKMLNGTEEEKIVTVNIKPGWKAGTKVRYDGMGTELRNGPAADIVCEWAAVQSVGESPLRLS